MFAARFFGPSYFARRYFGKIGAELIALALACIEHETASATISNKIASATILNSVPCP
jgi:hypothetical protein